MRRPPPAAGEGSFGRPAGMQPGRGAALLAVAVLLGIVLLNAADDPPPEQVVAGSTTTAPADATSTTGVVTTLATLPLRPPAEVKVLVANGTGIKGVAGKATDQLKAASYNVLAPTDAPSATASAVYFSGEFSREAAAVAASLGLPPSSVQPAPTPPPVADARGANVIVVVGPELAQQLGGGSTATTATTAKAAGTTSSTKP